MRIRIHLILFLFMIFMAEGCFIPEVVVDSDSSSPQQQPVLSPQERAEKSVSEYIVSNMKEAGTYKGYSFGEVETIIPKEILHLEQLRESRKEMAGMRDRYGDHLDSMLRAADTLIAQQERFIREKNIRNLYKIQHIFSLSKGKDQHKVLECRFYLSANFVVKDLHVLMDADLDEINYEWFHYYMKQLPLFTEEDEQFALKKSFEVYSYFNDRMQNFEGDKAALLKSVLVAVRLTRKFNQFDPQLIVKGVVIENYFSKPGYKALEFSTVNALTSKVAGKDSLLGYSVFHKFTSAIGNTPDSLQCHYFELDPWFMVIGSLVVLPPYEKYFVN